MKNIISILLVKIFIGMAIFILCCQGISVFALAQGKQLGDNSKISADRLEQIKEQMQKRLEGNPNDAKAYNDLGFALYQLGNKENGRNSIKKAVNLDDTNADYRYNLAWIFFMQNNNNRAEQHCRKVISINSNHARAHNLLGLILMGKKRWQNAVKEFEQAIKSEPGFAHAWSNLGKACTEMKNFIRAISVLKRAISLDDRLFETHFNLAVAFQAKADYAKAVSVLQKAKSTFPDKPELLFALARVYARWGKCNLALPHFNQALKQGIKALDCYLEMGSCHYKLKKWCKAAGSYGRAIEADSIDPRGYYGLGLALAAEGKKQKAIKNFKQVIEFDSSGIWAKKAIDKMKRLH